MTNFIEQRRQMVERQIAARCIGNRRLLDAMRAVPREKFVEPGFEYLAYQDSALPIGKGQTISQPYVVALMIDAAGVKPDDRVLEVGTGSGYAAAVMGRVAAKVYTIERHDTLATIATERFSELGYHNIEVRSGDGTLGWPEVAPFDAIIVAATAPQTPDLLKQQLAIGGRLIVPVGAPSEMQSLLKITRAGEAEYVEENLGPVRFVPLIGERAWGSDGVPPQIP